MLDLYVSETCPYCRKVMDFTDKNKIMYNKFDVANDDNVLRLLTFGGIDQVPFLYDSRSDKRLYESDKIIDYLKSVCGVDDEK